MDRDVVINSILDRCAPAAALAERAAVRAMIAYLDRSSLILVGDNGLQGRSLEIQFAGGGIRHVLNVEELVGLWARLRGGQAIDWSTLRQA